MERTFDYVPRLVEANRAFRVGAADPALLNVSRFWPPGAYVTDQGTEGACVGHGVVNEYMATPVRGRPANPDAEAFQVYKAAQRIDEWEGESYDGTSVRAGLLVGRSRGWWTGFRWAFNMLELRAMLEEGPVVVGVLWKSGMYSAPNGILRATGRVVGGHCVIITGYTRHHQVIGGPAYRIRNSWGSDWGYNGSAYIAADELENILFAAGGEAAVVTGRKLV